MDEMQKGRFVVNYKPTGTSWPHEPIPKKGRHGAFDTLEEAEAGLEACLRFFNRRITKMQVCDPITQKVEQEEEYIEQENIMAWIDEYEGQVCVQSGEPKCESESEKRELAKV